MSDEKQIPTIEHLNEIDIDLDSEVQTLEQTIQDDDDIEIWRQL